MNTFRNIECTGKQFIRDLLLGKLHTLLARGYKVNSVTLPGPAFKFENYVIDHAHVNLTTFEYDLKTFKENNKKIIQNRRFKYINEPIEPYLINCVTKERTKLYPNFVWLDWCGQLTIGKLRFINKFLKNYQSNTPFVIAFTILGGRETVKTQAFMSILMEESYNPENLKVFKNKWLPDQMAALLETSGVKTIDCRVLKYIPSTRAAGAPMITYVLSGE